MSGQNQHWVPQFLIRQFADADGRVFRVDIKTDEVSKVPPKRAASSVDFNEFKIDGEIVSFEEQLQKIETRAAPSLKRIVAARSLASVSPTDRLAMAEFIAAQSFRTEAFYKGMEGTSSRAEFGRTFQKLWRSAFIMADEIAQRHWALMTADNTEAFYLGDNPVVLQRTEYPTDGSNLGFDVEGVEAYMPLSPHCALYMPCRSVSEQIIEGYENALRIHRLVRLTALHGIPGGSTELALSQRVIRQSHSLYRSFAAGEPLAASSENIENLNYLQCSWAHTAVYSNCPNFDFALKVFRKTPQYRGAPATSLVDFVPRRWPQGSNLSRRPNGAVPEG